MRPVIYLSNRFACRSVLAFTWCILKPAVSYTANSLQNPPSHPPHSQTGSLTAACWHCPLGRRASRTSARTHPRISSRTKRFPSETPEKSFATKTAGRKKY
ncbi:hypothetical protein T492DRAFT_119540 [Pavlovales sp. CCMP2436]|nr:hypothetical protein T492DRAFT_119540 [Pavlovales sp. CCMP2436]